MTDFDDYFADPVALARRIDDYRDALAAISAALGSPGKDATAEDLAAWREMVPVRALLVAGVAEAILAGNAPIADHVRYIREQIAERPAPGA